MTPTQAQIEAAANAIVVEVCQPEGRDAWRIAVAALTAAAEVEPKIAATLTPGMLALIEKDRAAVLKKANLDGWSAGWDDAIERCAQVAESIEIGWADKQELRKKIAAAIRAMKDRP